MKPKEPIPEFKSRQEEAEFWDTHDLADYWDEVKPVKVRFARNLSEGITIRFDPETLAKLREQARKKGMGPTTLARMWILEHLQ
jgi:predicted DNA binding CopG/RHH family protein